MSLLLNEDFSTYLLRQAYLNHIHDGVGERLINLNTAVLNNPAFRAAGWFPDHAAIKRCYSPPIPTTSAGVGVGNEYFRPRNKGQLIDEGDVGDGGGMVTGQQGGEDTVGLGHGLELEKKRRRTRKEQLDEDDSSDLSDEEDSESDREKSAALGVGFRKLAGRGRSKSSPPPTGSQRTAQRFWMDDREDEDGLRVMVSSPSKPSEKETLQGRRRGRSFEAGQVQFVKQRARRDTNTSSEMSSENEGLDASGTFFNRKLPGRPDQRSRKTVLLSDMIEEEEIDKEANLSGDDRLQDSDLEDEDEDVDEASDLSDEFEASEDDLPAIAMLGIGPARASDDPSPLKPSQNYVPPPIGPTQNLSGSPRKKSDKDLSMPKLPRLPSGKPPSAVAPSSLITLALKGDSPDTQGSGSKPFQRFADLSGKGEASPLWIKIFAPFSTTPTKAIEVPLRRMREGQPVTVSELVGLALWRYNEEGYEPVLTADTKDSNINRWDLRIVEDEEIDYDFPALVRTRPVTDFTSNNNRPPQRRARDKPWDEFGLVRATDQQFRENEESTPQIGTAITPQPPPAPSPQPIRSFSRPYPARSDTETSSQSTTTFQPVRPNPITGPSFVASALRKDTSNVALDAR